MVYVDTSVVLAHVFAENRRPDPSLFREQLVASRLTSIEARVRLRALGRLHLLADVEEVLAHIALVEIDAVVEAEAARLNGVRTLDAIHVATACLLAVDDPGLTVATYDQRLLDVAASEGIQAWHPPRPNPEDT